MNVAYCMQLVKIKHCTYTCMHIFFYPTLTVFKLTHVFLYHRGLTGYVAVDYSGFERSTSIGIDWEISWGTSCEPVGLAGGFKDGLPENKKQNIVNSCWASSKKENGLFSIVENACLFAFLSSITKFKRTEKKKHLITFKHLNFISSKIWESWKSL